MKSRVDYTKFIYSMAEWNEYDWAKNAQPGMKCDECGHFQRDHINLGCMKVNKQNATKDEDYCPCKVKEFDSFAQIVYNAINGVSEDD